MTRRLAAFAIIFAWSPLAWAQGPIPANTAVEELAHTVAVEVERDGASLRVTRSLFNPSLIHAEVELPIELPCAVTLAELEVEELGPDGRLQWRAAALIEVDDADARFNAYSLGATDPSITVAGNADTAVLMSREASSDCDATLRVYPIPPLQTRRVSYRLWVPSTYDSGRYTITLPSLAHHYGRTPTVEVQGFNDRSLRASIDDQAFDSAGATLDGGYGHEVVLTPYDGGRGRVRAADLDLAALASPSPTGLPRVLEAEFEAPITLASLPPIRRAVIVLDASRSLASDDRKQLQQLGAAYLEAIGARDPHAEVEILLFDRKVRRLFHAFVPAAWGAVELAELDVQDGNGSEVGEAIRVAREVLAEPRTATAAGFPAGADWILVLSDLDLREGFDFNAQREAAASGSARIHVVRHDGSTPEFFPAAADDPWTAIARAAQGMAWATNGRDDAAAFADELVAPRRLWKLELELEFADRSHHSEALGSWLDAGSTSTWLDLDYAGASSAAPAALVRAAFVGEVWGQRRAWTITPSELEGRRTAAALATNQTQYDLSHAARAALAHYAGVISPSSSAWILARFAGQAPLPFATSASIGGFGGRIGYTTRCGGVGTRSARAPSAAPSFADLADQALERCRVEPEGSYSFETTDSEIVAVDSAKRCIREQTWATDISPVRSRGHKRITIAYAQGRVVAVEERPI